MLSNRVTKGTFDFLSAGNVSGKDWQGPPEDVGMKLMGGSSRKFAVKAVAEQAAAVSMRDRSLAERWPEKQSGRSE